jgi:hypothetical protein
VGLDPWFVEPFEIGREADDVVVAAGVRPELDQKVEIGVGAVVTSGDGAEYPDLRDGVAGEDLGDVISVPLKQLSGPDGVDEACFEVEAGGVEQPFKHRDRGLSST